MDNSARNLPDLGVYVDSLMSLCVCFVVVMICSQVKWTHILLPSVHVSQMSNTQLIFAHQ